MNFCEKDAKLLRTICALSAENLRQCLVTTLQKYYQNVNENNKFLYAVGNIPVALVAHLDTVFSYPSDFILYDKELQIMWGEYGAGFDDRAGVFAILKIVQAGLRPSIIFTMDEEIGALGAQELVDKFIVPASTLKYIVELDRRGKNDCVFYSCINNDFTAYVEKFGFEKNLGSFSDISEICPIWGVAGVNVSVGYFNEHTPSEYLNVDYLMDTIRRVIKMLKEADKAPIFKYMSRQTQLNVIDINSSYTPNKKKKKKNKFKDYSIKNKCDICGTEHFDFEMIPIVLSDTAARPHKVCNSCISTKIDWCDICGSPYIKTEQTRKGLCEKCSEKGLWEETYAGV